VNNTVNSVAGGALPASDLRAGEGLPMSGAPRAAFDETLVLAAESIAVEEEAASSDETPLEDEDTPLVLDAQLVPANACALLPLPLAMLAAADAAPPAAMAPARDGGAAASSLLDQPAQAPSAGEVGAGETVETARDIAGDIAGEPAPLAKDEAPHGGGSRSPVPAEHVRYSEKKDAGVEPEAIGPPSRAAAAAASAGGGEARASHAAKHAGAAPGVRDRTDVQARPGPLPDAAAASPNAHGLPRGSSVSGGDADTAAAPEAKAGPRREAPSAERQDVVDLVPPASPETFAFAPPIALPMETVKTVSAVTIPAVADMEARMADRDVSGGIRAAEAAGHRRVLAGEAHGRISVPELGNVEVRAIADASRVDVHVQADESQARDVILAHAPALSAHVQREVPEARIHLEGSPPQNSHPSDARASADPGRHHGESRREAPADRELGGPRSSVKSVGVPSDLRHRARVRIVL